MACRVIVGQRTTAGSRAVHCDTLRVLRATELTLCQVAEGGSTRAMAEFASTRATYLIERELRMRFRTAPDSNEVPDLIQAALVQVNEELLTLSNLDRELRHFGTAFVFALHCNDSKIYLVGVGNCRGYLCRDAALRQLTIDHVTPAHLVSFAPMTPEELAEVQGLDCLTRWLPTTDFGTQITVVTLEVRPRDRLLLCTAGLTHSVTDDQLRSVLSTRIDPQPCADALCQQALDSGTRDDVSCIVVEVVEEPATASAAGGPAAPA